MTKEREQGRSAGVQGVFFSVCSRHVFLPVREYLGSDCFSSIGRRDADEGA